jgi:membrane protein implicated in regulation of membrane protease activity
MSSSSGLDVRLPIGGLFVALGLLLGGYGLVTAADPTHYARSLSVNINLWWGLVMLAFGLLLLLIAWRGRQKLSAPPGGSSLEGQATELRERRLGLENRKADS